MARQQGPLNDVATSSNGIRSQASERRFKNSCELPWQHNHLQQAHTEYADIIPVEQEVESSTSIYFISYLMFLLFYTLKTSKPNRNVKVQLATVPFKETPRPLK